MWLNFDASSLILLVNNQHKSLQKNKKKSAKVYVEDMDAILKASEEPYFWWNLQNQIWFFEDLKTCLKQMLLFSLQLYSSK